MTVLKIAEEKRTELTSRGIVICTYLETSGNEVDAISEIYASDYPDFEPVQVVETY